MTTPWNRPPAVTASQRPRPDDHPDHANLAAGEGRQPHVTCDGSPGQHEPGHPADRDHVWWNLLP